MRQTTWQVLLLIAVFVSISLYLLLTSAYDTLHIVNRPKQTPAEDVREEDVYEWTTTSSYRQATEEDVNNATIEGLCQYFPKEKLHDIQPVLKTGHGALDRVRSQLKSSAACLDNLLIFSDLDEELEGRSIFDTIADIPQHLIESDNQTLPYRHLKDLAANGSLNDTTLSRLQGWETDKFKFLPDISRAWHISPERQWYVYFEGDTFLLWDTIFRLLEHFDPDEPHYFGSPSPGRDGTWFANGGPGFILSRAAMRKLTHDDYDSQTGEYLGSQLSSTHWHETLVNCCGDSIAGWALWSANITLSGLWPMFNPHPPHGVPFSDLYWCQPVLSMHKPLEGDMTKLWRWEWQNRKTDRPLLYRDMAVSYFQNFQFTQRENWDNAEWDGFDPPNDTTYNPHASIATCSTACEKHENCFQWTYHRQRCYFVHSFRLGREREPSTDGDWTIWDQRFVAGWDTAKIKKWIDQRPCEKVQWVKPSTERIF
ncbi:hypothetical protein Slin15195_G082790 [Septoria linicola]|uniref:N-acetylgalactosaminide beta-1,3-galactosyltransferase n=1 Tax=Septoria linicola TaxID=215465 RepID=A0A9Q9ELC7_9PEZI|nr:hypothetical protein Slin15195_G082790 [Septoria linicola]